MPPPGSAWPNGTVGVQIADPVRRRSRVGGANREPTGYPCFGAARSTTATTAPMAAAAPAKTTTPWNPESA